MKTKSKIIAQSLIKKKIDSTTILQINKKKLLINNKKLIMKN